MRHAIAVVVVLTWAAASHAQPQRAALEDQASKQAEIYQSVGEAVPAGYVIDRSLLSYVTSLPADFRRSLAKLGGSHRWLDIGAGEGRAVLDYATARYDVMLEGRDPAAGRAQAIALSIEDRRTVRWHRTAETLPANQIQYLFGRRLREYSREELGKFELITDVLGAFSYTRVLSRFMETALGALTTNGIFYTVLQDVRTEAGTNRPHYPGASFLTEIANDGAELRVCTWLKSIRCVEVTCEPRPESVPPSEMYRIRKVCDAVEVPRLELTHFEAGTPPERRFRVSAPPGAAPERAQSTR